MQADIEGKQLPTAPAQTDRIEPIKGAPAKTALPSLIHKPSSSLIAKSALTKSASSLKQSNASATCLPNASTTMLGTKVMALSDSKILRMASSTTSLKTATTNTSATLKGKSKANAFEEDMVVPSQTVKAQMEARVRAQMQASRSEPVMEATEHIELPDINSEYSDSDDEDRKRTDYLAWTTSPEVRNQLRAQASLNPDDIFGAVPVLNMETLFKVKDKSKFRMRTSSANWIGTDGLTVEEEIAYAKRMGYTR